MLLADSFVDLILSGILVSKKGKVKKKKKPFYCYCQFVGLCSYLYQLILWLKVKVKLQQMKWKGMVCSYCLHSKTSHDMLEF